jgi:hypothetical protein
MPKEKNPQSKAYKLNYLFSYSPFLLPLGPIIFKITIFTRSNPLVSVN